MWINIDINSYSDIIKFMSKEIDGLQSVGVSIPSSGDYYFNHFEKPMAVENYDWWERSLTEVDVKSDGKRVTTFKIEDRVVSEQTGISEISVFEKPKEGYLKNADSVLVRKINVFSRANTILVFVADGLNYVQEPPNELRPILEEFECTDRPDRLPSAILHEPLFRESIFNTYNSYFSRSGYHSDGEKFLNIVNYQLGEFYKSRGVNLDLIKNSQLPSMCGTVCMINIDGIEVCSIGDLPNKVKDSTNTFQNISPLQNLGIDRLTVSKINELLEKGVGNTVTEVRMSREFKDWIRFTFDNKIGKIGGVTVINGKERLLRQRAISIKIPLGFVSAISINTDGVTLGAVEPDSPFKEIDQCKNSSDYLKFLDQRTIDQKNGYRENVCVQEKESDDIGGVYIRRENSFLVSELGSMLK